MPLSAHRLRQPKQQYVGQNGFTEPPRTMAQKIEAHEHAQEILALRSNPLPSMKEIRATDWTNDPVPTVADIEKEIADLQQDHSIFLSKLYDLNATSYLADIKYRYQSRDASLDIDPRDWVKTEFRYNSNAMQVDFEDEELNRMTEVSEAQKKLYNKSSPYPFSPTSPTAYTLPSVSRHNYEYQKRLSKLQTTLHILKEGENRQRVADHKRMEQENYNARRREEERKRLEERERREVEKRFPTSIEDFESKGRDMQLRVGTFLDGGRSALATGKPSHLQEKMMTEWHWKWEEVQPLLKEYAMNDEFRNVIQIEARQTTTTDPRRAGSSAYTG